MVLMKNMDINSICTSLDGIINALSWRKTPLRLMTNVFGCIWVPVRSGDELGPPFESHSFPTPIEVYQNCQMQLLLFNDV